MARIFSKILGKLFEIGYSLQALLPIYWLRLFLDAECIAFLKGNQAHDAAFHASSFHSRSA